MYPFVLGLHILEYLHAGAKYGNEECSNALIKVTLTITDLSGGWDTIAMSVAINTVAFPA